MVLLVINVFLLFVGCFLDPASALIMLTPLLAPVAASLGIDPIHFGVIVVMNLTIGTFHPPFGLNIFVCQALFKTPSQTLYIGLIPFVAIAVLALDAGDLYPGHFALDYAPACLSGGHYVAIEITILPKCLPLC